MLSDEPHLTYRFVVLFRREPREISGAAEEWRGSVRRVPSALEEEPKRVGFRQLSELPEVIRTLIDQAMLSDTTTGQ